MPDPYGTEEMFPIPDKYRPPKRVAKYPQWRKHTGKRTSCDDCIRSIASGKREFIAEPASMVRTDANGRQFFCYRHSMRRKEADGL